MIIYLWRQLQKSVLTLSLNKDVNWTVFHLKSIDWYLTVIDHTLSMMLAGYLEFTLIICHFKQTQQSNFTDTVVQNKTECTIQCQKWLMLPVQLQHLCAFPVSLSKLQEGPSYLHKINIVAPEKNEQKITKSHHYSLAWKSNRDLKDRQAEFSHSKRVTNV